MAKELQVAKLPKLDNFLKELIKRFATDWPKIIGQGAVVEFKNYECLMFDKFKEISNDKSMLLEYEMSGERSGKMYLMVSFRNASIIGGSILMEEEDNIKKNISASQMSEDYMDAFGEFGNQAAACFETIYRNTFPNEDDNHIRFVKLYSALTETGKLSEVFAAEDDDELLISHMQCSVWSFDKENIDLVLPVDVAENLFNETVTTSTIKSFAHILYVDTEKKDISLFKKLLRNTGYTAHICFDADNAIAKLQQEKIDLIIIEAKFRDHENDDGLALCLRIKRNMLLDNIPIIMTTAKATKSLVLDCVRIRASDFMVKPLSKGKLLVKVQTSYTQGYIKRVKGIISLLLSVRNEISSGKTGICA
ncbi:MAG: response regulator [Candidatus Anammoxibacter sp.]